MRSVEQRIFELLFLILLFSTLPISSGNLNQGFEVKNIDQGSTIIPNPITFQNDLTYDLDVVIIGFEDFSVNDLTLYLDANAPQWYAPIDRYGFSFGFNDQLYGNYSINYNVIQTSPSTSSLFRSYIESISTETDAPWMLGSDVDKVKLVPSSLVEEYLYNNFRSDETPAIFLIDTYSYAPGTHFPYYYNVSSFDIDIDQRPRLSSGKYQTAGGGENHRLVWLDLSAGPTEYRGVIDDVSHPPIWNYNIAYDQENLMNDLSHYVSSAVELKFLPSYIYKPVGETTSIVFEMIMVDLTLGAGVDFYSLIDGDKVVDEYGKANPNYDWSYTLSDWDWSSDLDFVNVLNLSYNATSNRYDSWPILDYLDSIYNSLTTQSNSSVTYYPIFLFAFADSKLFTDFLGLANSDDFGKFTYAVAAINEKYADPSPDLTNASWYEYYGDTIAPTFYSWITGTLGKIKNIMKTSIDITSGTANVYIMDLYNYNQYQLGNSYTTVYSLSLITGFHTFNVTLESYDDYYWIIENAGGLEVIFDILIDEYSQAGFGLTFVVMHELGHAVGLSHPHDGFTWDGNYNYVEWIWDFTYTQMTYAQHHNNIGKLDYDTMQRGIAYYQLTELTTRYNSILEKIRIDHEYIPDSLSFELESTEVAMISTKLYFDDYKLPNNFKIIFDSYDQTLQKIISLEAIDWNDYIFSATIELTGDLSRFDIDIHIKIGDANVVIFNDISSNILDLGLLGLKTLEVSVFVDGILYIEYQTFTWIATPLIIPITSDESINSITPTTSSQDTSSTSNFTIPLYTLPWIVSIVIMSSLNRKYSHKKSP